MKYRPIKKILLIGALFGGVAVASDLPDCPSDTGDYWHNCFSAFTWENGDKYVGEWENNKIQGQGTMTRLDGTVEEGIWKDNEFQYANIVSVDSESTSNLPKCPSDTGTLWNNCFGTFTYDDGNKYVGEWKDNNRGGQGTYTYADDGRVKEGTWKDNKLNGQGTLTHTNGHKYVGGWLDGRYFGQGTLTYADWYGQKDYVGKFKNSLEHGQGTKTWLNGDKYVGEWNEGSMAGQGTYTWEIGRKYVGQFKDGDRSGQGTFTWENGDKYVGEFRNNNINGQGTFTYEDGRVVKGLWEDNEFLGTKAELERAENERIAKEQQEENERIAKVQQAIAELERAENARIAKEQQEELLRQKKLELYYACILDKGSDVDMTVSLIEEAVMATCKSIANNPSFTEDLKYN